MFLELNPGTKSAPLAKEGFIDPGRQHAARRQPRRVPRRRSTPTRATTSSCCSTAPGDGLKGNGDDLREVLRRFEPTYRDLAAVTDRGRQARRTELRRLDQLAAAPEHDARRARTTTSPSSSARRRACSARSPPSARTSSATVRELPSALQAGDAARCARSRTLANVLGPTAERAAPGGPRAARGERRARAPFALEAAPRLRDDIRPFVRELRPLVRDLRPAARGPRRRASPGLTRTFTVLNHFFNMLAYNKDGREGPEKADRDEGYLFYTRLARPPGQQPLLATPDAHGPGRPITFGGTCAIDREHRRRAGGARGAARPDRRADRPGACAAATRRRERDAKSGGEER